MTDNEKIMWFCAFSGVFILVFMLGVFLARRARQGASRPEVDDERLWRIQKVAAKVGMAIVIFYFLTILALGLVTIFGW